MSFEISYSSLRKRSFQIAYKKLMASSDFPGVKASYDVSRLGQYLEKEIKIADELFMKEYKRLLAEYVEADEKGDPIQDKETGLKFKDDAAKTAFGAEVEKFHEHAVTIERNKLPMRYLDKVKELTPMDLLELEAVLEDSDE